MQCHEREPQNDWRNKAYKHKGAGDGETRVRDIIAGKVITNLTGLWKDTRQAETGDTEKYRNNKNRLSELIDPDRYVIAHKHTILPSGTHIQ